MQDPKVSSTLETLGVVFSCDLENFVCAVDQRGGRSGGVSGCLFCVLPSLCQCLRQLVSEQTVAFIQVCPTCGASVPTRLSLPTLVRFPRIR